nr:hypothetical protein [Ardenticatenales bacterium]
MRARAASQALFALTLLWGTVLSVTLGFLQIDLFLPELAALLAPLRAALAALALLVAALGIGWTLVRAMALPATTEEQWLLAGLLGLGAVGLLWLAVGMVLLPPLWATILLLALGIALLWWQRGPLPGLPALPRLLLPLLVVMVMLPLLQALQPPTSFDALLYHVRLPELWLAQGSLFQSQKAAPYFFPVLIEALFTPAYQLGGDATPALLHWFYYLLALALLWQMTRRFLPEISASLVLALAVTIQMVPLLAGWSYLDLALAAYQVGALWALLRWREQPESRWHWVAGAFAGFAMGVKYLSFITPVLGVLFILAVRRRTALAPLVAFSLVAGLVGCPSYLRNLIGTGNPFFPFVLPSAHWDAFRAAWYGATGTGIGFSLLELLLVPWNTTLGLR